MHYVIYGAGAVGSVLAAHLAMADHRVTIVARPATVSAIAAQGGLAVSGLVERQGVPLEAVEHIGHAEITPTTTVLLTMKSYDTAAALESAAEQIGTAPVVCCQNGVANERVVAEHGLRAYGAVIVVGASMVAPGHVTYTSPGHIDIGRWPAGVDETCLGLSQNLSRAGFPARAVGDTMSHKWSKLLRNLTNAYMALVGASINDVGASEQHRAFCADIIDEALHVLERAGVDYEPEQGSYDAWIAHKAGVSCVRGDGTVAAEVADLRRPGTRRVTGGTSYASTWQDLKAGRTKLEVSSFNGEVIRIGKSLGIATPINELLLERVLDAASRSSGPGTETTESLRSQLRDRS